MKTRPALLTFAIAATVAIGTFGFFWTRSHSVELRDVSYANASAQDPVRAFLPPEAQRITAWIMPYRMIIVASFRIGEDDFRAWAKAKRWNLAEIRKTTIENISRIGNPDDAVEIQDGLYYKWSHNPDDPGTTSRIYAYDRGEGTGYFSQLGD